MHDLNRWRAPACAAALCLGALALPGIASAHSRAATVALDYRLSLDSAGGVKASILDGDRALRVAVAGNTRVVVLGDLGEPMLRVADGVWVNQSSPTAQANRIVARTQPGWKRVASSRAFTWHEHRLAPPPFAAGPYGRVASWRVPLLVDGQRTSISGAFVRIPRPSFWPWALGAVVVVGLAAVAVQRAPQRRLAITVGSGVLAGVAGLTAQTSFALRDAPTGRGSWALIVAAFCDRRGRAGPAGRDERCAAGIHRRHDRDRRRGDLPLVAGRVLPRRGDLALPAQATRVVCAVAFSTGLIALLGVLRIEAVMLVAPTTLPPSVHAWPIGVGARVPARGCSGGDSRRSAGRRIPVRATIRRVSTSTWSCSRIGR